jgi:mannose-6-phosphate isomerase-like protein (cupin superfamily)
VVNRAAPYVLAPGESRRQDAILPFKALASDTGGLLSVCEFTLGAWESGPVLHRHTLVDEAFYVVAGHLEAQLDDERVQAAAGGFLWVPRGTAHAFANAGPQPLHVLAVALPGGVEALFAEQATYLASVQGPPDRRCWTRSAPATAPRRWDPPSAPPTPPRHRDRATSS